jgi:tetrahydromethanopterin S-methyltransferase subunit G
MKRLLGFILILMIRIATPSQAQEQQVVPYTLADRDRAIQTEERLTALEERMDTKFNALEQKMDAAFNALETKINALESKLDTKINAVNTRIDFLFWLMTFMGALLISMFGYLIWDRRTALKPALDKAQSADIKCGSILIMLRDYAKEKNS